MAKKTLKAIQESRSILMEYWPLQSYIATNPLWGLHKRPFFDVVSQSSFCSLMDVEYYYRKYKTKLITKDDLQKAISLVDDCLIEHDALDSWIEASLKQAAISSPSILFAEQVDEYNFQNTTSWIKERLFVLFRDYYGLENYKDVDLITYWYKNNNVHLSVLTSLSSMSAEDAITFLVKKLAIPESILPSYFKAIYLKVYGWASFMNWRNQHINNPWIPGKDPCEAIILFWLSYEFLVSLDKKILYQESLAGVVIDEKFPSLKYNYIWQTAFELHYFSQLTEKLTGGFRSRSKHVDAQFIFCIDTRSEGFRRHLENADNIETFGYAGFFGAIFNIEHEDGVSYQAPALVKATHTMSVIKKNNFFNRVSADFKKIIVFCKKQLSAPFALFEMAGIWFLPFMIFKTIQPNLVRKKKTLSMHIVNTFSEEEKFKASYNLLKTIGLVNFFSKDIFICAHQSDNINNAFQSSLNCGACGGNSGVPNALLMCDILNSVTIREKLKSSGIDIPKESRFIPACHHTGDDRLEILKGDVNSKMKKSIDVAAKNLRKEKSQSLPGISPLSQRENNWSELIPELGLINNTAIIIGPRALTHNKDFQRRVFLHSYDVEQDHDGEILTAILSAPAIVAHWISSQYYFSTVNPELFGAGNKAIHNVLPGIGVLEGNLSDLKVGLPLQSTHFRSEPIHEPRRIIIVVYAKKEILTKAINSSPIFKTLLDNQWIYLKHINA